MWIWTRFSLVLASLVMLLALSTPADAIVITNPVTVAATATLVWTAPAGFGTVLVRNTSAVTVFVGNSAVTTATGFSIGAGDALKLTLANRGTLYGIVASGTAVVNTITGDNIQ